MIRNDLRNIAIIAHVDHGKTTLVDQMLKQGGTFRDNQVVADRVMDSGALERERGITILAKNTSVHYNGVKINIVDTPGHADFSGEVERSLKMVSGVLILVDAAEGPMPQTRFVMQKALELGLKLIIVVNKVDRPDARIPEVIDEVLELLMDLDATDDQLESPFVFCSGRAGTASLDQNVAGSDLTPLFDTVLSHFPPLELDETGALQILVSSIDYNEYVGRIGIGRIERGVAKPNSEVIACNYNHGDTRVRGKLVNLYEIEGLERVPSEDFEEYRLSTAADGKVCDICRELAKKKFRIQDRQPGVNFPPLHPWCRCTFTIEVEDWDKWMEDYEQRHGNVQAGKIAKGLNDGGENAILGETNDKEKADVHIVGKIDKNIYKCITEDIITDEVIITDERIQHIRKRHPNDYERFYSYIPEIIENPDYIIEANKSNTAVILKEIEEQGEKFKLVLRLKVESDPAEYKNSIMTFWYIGDTTWRKSLKNKKILYKRE